VKLAYYFAASKYTTSQKRAEGHIKPYQVVMFSNTNTITQTGYQPSNGKNKVSEIIVAKGELKQITILFTENFTRMKVSRKITKSEQ